MKKELLAILLGKGFPEVTNHLHNVNCGGCLRFAFEAKQQLEQRLGVKVDIVIMGFDISRAMADARKEHQIESKGINDFYWKLKRKALEDDYFGVPHCGIKVCDRIFDCDGEMEPWAWSGASTPPITDKVVRDLLASHDNWNPLFEDSNENIDIDKMMKTMIHKHIRYLQNLVK